MDCRIIVGVPGPWEDAMALSRATTSASGMPPFLVLGPVLVATEADHPMALEVRGHDARLARAFEVAGAGRFSPAELRAIERHHTVAYLVDDAPSPASARWVMRAAEHLLDLGGLGVKVETAGVAHPPDRWRYLTRSPSTLSVYEAMVVLVGGGASGCYSCGMQAFALPDAWVPAAVPAGPAAGILTTFNHWNLLERPALEDGAGFATAEREQAFTLRRRPYGYEPDSPLNNPQGRWELEPTDGRPAAAGFGVASGEPMFMALRRDDPALKACVARARASLPYFLAHFASPHEYGTHLVKLQLRDGEHSAYVWAALAGVEGETLSARFFEVPKELRAHRSGQVVAVPAGEVQDWAILKSGTLLGGFSMRLQRSHVPEERRRAYDLYSGTLSYAPLEEIPGA